MDGEETVNVGEGEMTLAEEAAGDKHVNEEESVESDENSSLEGDDCEVIVEDRAGYKESDPVLRSDENEFVDIEVGVAKDISAYFGEAVRDDEEDAKVVSL